jgi:tetratricopeptide repeat protein 8
MRGTRPGTSRPVTALGREVRLGTASMAAAAESGNGVFINSDRLDLRKYARRPAMAMVSSSSYSNKLVCTGSRY